MLRISVHDHAPTITLQLEGSLAGPWVRVLEECWQSNLTNHRRQMLRVDLTGVMSIDAAGQDCLGAMHRKGAKFIAVDPLTKGIVAEITQGPLPDCERPKDKGSK